MYSYYTVHIANSIFITKWSDMDCIILQSQLTWSLPSQKRLTCKKTSKYAEFQSFWNNKKNRHFNGTMLFNKWRQSDEYMRQ